MKSPTFHLNTTVQALVVGSLGTNGIVIYTSTAAGGCYVLYCSPNTRYLIFVMALKLQVTPGLHEVYRKHIQYNIGMSSTELRSCSGKRWACHLNQNRPLSSYLITQTALRSPKEDIHEGFGVHIPFPNCLPHAGHRGV